MKTLFPVSFVSALVAFLIFPVNFEVAVSLLVTGGCMAIAVVDYAQTRRPRLVPARVTVTSSRNEKFRLAA
jgi:hypothetical protein